MSKVNYRDQITVETSATIDATGQRTITAKVQGDKRLFDCATMFEEKGCIEALDARIKRVIENEICTALAELDSFFSAIAAKKRTDRKRKPVLKLTKLNQGTGT